MLFGGPICPTDSLPALAAAFLIASQIPGGVFSRPVLIHIASE
jgi:hypothetical protein